MGRTLSAPAKMRARCSRALTGEAQKETEIGSGAGKSAAGLPRSIRDCHINEDVLLELEALTSPEVDDGITVLGIKVADMNLRAMS